MKDKMAATKNPGMKDIYYHPVEIEITGAGSVIHIDEPMPLLYELVLGAVLFHPGGNHGKGTLKLSVAGEEIFPEGFHAKAYMYCQNSHFDIAEVSRDLDECMYPFRERAMGSTISLTYQEPENGSQGTIYLIFKLLKKSSCQ